MLKELENFGYHLFLFHYNIFVTEIMKCKHVWSILKWLKLPCYILFSS